MALGRLHLSQGWERGQEAMPTSESVKVLIVVKVAEVTNSSRSLSLSISLPNRAGRFPRSRVPSRSELPGSATDKFGPGASGVGEVCFPEVRGGKEAESSYVIRTTSGKEKVQRG